MKNINVTIFNEFIHEQQNEFIKKLYPKGMHSVIGEYLKSERHCEVKYATLEMEDHGLKEEILKNTDVLIWWGHVAHDKVKDEIVDRIQKRVLDGMGLIVLHSGHMAKIFRRLMGTSCSLCWREAGEKERIWVVSPHHPIAQGIGPYFELPHTEMYGEFFDIPQPDDLIFISWFEGGNVFRSGAVWYRGKGKIFYFRPGHETYPIYYDKNVLQVIGNAVEWLCFNGNKDVITNECPNVKVSLEPIKSMEK